ncbi:MAG: D-alanyl-D-alanine carboxypeptidase family protein [Thermodesulfobacteriota bacterium]
MIQRWFFWCTAVCVLGLWFNSSDAREAIHPNAKTKQTEKHAVSAKPVSGKASTQKPKKTPATEKPALATEKPPESQPPYKAFIVVEAETGTVVEGENVHQPCPPASITKLMLAAVVLDMLESGQIRLDDPVKASTEAASMGGSQVYLKPGEVFSLDEMMKAVMVASANDAAYAVAEFVAGSRAECVQLMNEKAQKIGMKDSEFFSPHGLPPAPGQKPDISSPHDLALLARELVKHPLLLSWTSLHTEPFRNGSLVMRNHNNLMNRFVGMDGLKTGFYREAGYSIVATAMKGDLRFIAVVMGSPTAKIRDNIVEAKLNRAFSLYDRVRLVRKGEVIDKDVLLPDGVQPSMKPIAAADFSYMVLREKRKLLTKSVELPEQVSGAVQQGQRLGQVVIRFNNEEVGRVDLIAPAAVAKKGFFKRLFD